MARKHIIGCILGTAVGDALGLPYEGLKPHRPAKLLGPPEWLDGLFEWPRSVAWMEKLGGQLGASLHSESKVKPLKMPVWGLLLRNLFFLNIVLYHGFRRLFPPY